MGKKHMKVDVLTVVAEQDRVTATEAPATEAPATEPATEAPATEAPATEAPATADAPKGAKVRAIERILELFPEAKRAGWKVWSQELLYDNATTEARVAIVSEDIQDTVAREAILAIVKGMEPAAPPAKGTARKPAKLSAEGAKAPVLPVKYHVALVDASLVRVRVVTEHRTKDGVVTSYRVRQVDKAGKDLTQTSPIGETIPAEGTIPVSDIMAEEHANAFVMHWEYDRLAFETRTFGVGDRVRVFDRGDGSSAYHDGTVHQSSRAEFPLRVVWDAAHGGDVSRDYTAAELSRVGFSLPKVSSDLYARLWKGAVELSKSLGDYVPDGVVITALRAMGAGAELTVHPALWDDNPATVNP